MGYRDTLEDIILLAKERGVPPGQGTFRYLDSSPTEMLLCGRWVVYQFEIKDSEIRFSSKFDPPFGGSRVSRE